MKAIVCFIMAVAPIVAGRIAWIQLFGGQLSWGHNLTLNYIQVFFGEPLYLTEVLIFFELICLFVLFLDKIAPRLRAVGALVALSIVSSIFGVAYYQGLVPGCHQARMDYGRMSAQAQDKVGPDFERGFDKVKAAMDHACGT